MFTGIIETIATVANVVAVATNIDGWMESAITHELKIDQSVAHNGVCLTVVAIEGNRYKVTAIAETIQKTNLGSWQPGDKVNIERSLRVGDRLDGHFVQGHVDATAVCELSESQAGSWLYRFRFPKQYGALVIEKGSICINGVSLTAFDITEDSLTVAIIPYTYEHTNFHNIIVGTVVNMEFDVLGKYLWRKEQLQTS